MDKKIIDSLENSVETLKEAEAKLKEIYAILLRIGAQRQAMQKDQAGSLASICPEFADQFKPLGECPICGGGVIFRDNDRDKSYDLCTNGHEFPSSMTKFSAETAES